MSAQIATQANNNKLIRFTLLMGVIGAVCFLCMIVIAAEQGTPWLTLFLLCACAVQVTCAWCGYVKASEDRKRGGSAVHADLLRTTTQD
jgi:uncharacterized membrane protein